MKAFQPEAIRWRFAGMGAASLLLSALIAYTVFWVPNFPTFCSGCAAPSIIVKDVPQLDELGKVLEKAAMVNRTLIISMLDEEYAEDGGMLDLFLQSLRHGEDTEPLIKHLVFMAIDQASFDRCVSHGLHCHQLLTEEEGEFSEEVMWLKVKFLGKVLKRGYNFIYTDMDVLWLRNPFVKLNHIELQDLQISCDSYNGRPLDDSNTINSGFYVVASNNRTIAFYDIWYASRKILVGMNEQDVLSQLKSEGIFRQLGIKVWYLNNLYFCGFCSDERDFKEVRTVSASCCPNVKAKIADLTEVLEGWKTINGTSTPTWPAHKACLEAWQIDAASKELETALVSASMENKTVIIGVVNKAYVEENGMLDLFLRSLKQGEDTEFLIKHLLLVAVDQIAFDRCKLLNLNCYRLVTEDVDFSKEQLYMSDGFIKMMWQRTHFLGDVLKRGYSFIFTDMDVMWLRNPLTKLSREGEDMQISCDWYSGNPFSNSSSINTGFYFVASNNKTTALFDAWYEARSNSTGMKEQDVLSQMKSAGTFTQLGLKVRYLDTLYFNGFCQKSRDIRQVITVHANCCRSVNAKQTDLSRLLEAWGSFNGTTIEWSGPKACSESWKRNIIV